jgi:hypothetical protein
MQRRARRHFAAGQLSNPRFASATSGNTWWIAACQWGSVSSSSVQPRKVFALFQKFFVPEWRIFHAIGLSVLM